MNNSTTLFGTSNNWITPICLLSSAAILLLSYGMRIGLHPFTSSINYLSIYGLAAILFSLPSLLAKQPSLRDKWFGSEEFITLAILFGFSAVGMLFEFRTEIGLAIFTCGFLLSLAEFRMVIREKLTWTTFVGVSVLLFVVLIFYSSKHHVPLLHEQIILGTVYHDQLYHSSISNMFSSFWLPATGLDGLVYCRYHWGSHALFAGLNSWIGGGALNFYNVAYAAIFAPLFYKAMFQFTLSWNRLKNFATLSPLFLLTATVFLLSLYLPGSVRSIGTGPVGNESLCVAFIIAYLYGSILLRNLQTIKSEPTGFYIFSVIVLLLLVWTKVSVGSVLLVVFSYLLLRFKPSFSSLVAVLFIFLIVGAFVHFAVAPTFSLVFPATPLARYINLWHLSLSFVTYLFGGFLAIIILLKKEDVRGWSSLVRIYKSKQYVELEALLIMTMAGFAAGIIVSAFAPDVFHFNAIQMFFTVSFIIIYLNQGYESLATKGWVRSAFLMLALFLTIISRPSIVFGMVELRDVKRDLKKLTSSQKMLEKLVVNLDSLGKEGGNSSRIIYIPQTEKWLFKSQRTDHCSATIVPAVSGIPMIGGISDSLYNLNANDYGNFYGLYDYRLAKLPKINNLDDAIAESQHLGFKELIYFREEDGELSKTIFPLSSAEKP